MYREEDGEDGEKDEEGEEGEEGEADQREGVCMIVKGEILVYNVSGKGR